jgi:hypothetical protein
VVGTVRPRHVALGLASDELQLDFRKSLGLGLRDVRGDRR